jgi:MFS family permease
VRAVAAGANTRDARRKGLLVTLALMSVGTLTIALAPILVVLGRLRQGFSAGVELWLSFLYAGYNGAMVVHLTEIVPVAALIALAAILLRIDQPRGGSRT